MSRLTVETTSQGLELKVQTSKEEVVLSLDDNPWASMEEALADLAKIEAALGNDWE